MKRKKIIIIITSHDVIRVYHLALSVPYRVCCYSNSEPYINRSFYKKKNRSLRTRAMYLVIEPDRSWYICQRIFSLFSIYKLLPYLRDIVKILHLTLELTLIVSFIFVWFPLISLTNIASSNFIGSDACKNSSLYGPLQLFRYNFQNFSKKFLTIFWSLIVHILPMSG